MSDEREVLTRKSLDKTHISCERYSASASPSFCVYRYVCQGWAYARVERVYRHDTCTRMSPENTHARPNGVSVISCRVSRSSPPLRLYCRDKNAMNSFIFFRVFFLLSCNVNVMHTNNMKSVVNAVVYN